MAPAALLALIAAPHALQAQTVSLCGTLSNFDVVSDTGGNVYGFEIEFHGVSGVNRYYNWNRYGRPKVVPFPNGGGVFVRWMSAYDPATRTFVTGTPMALSPTVMTGHQYVIGTFGYSTSGCEHFGLTTVGNASKIIYHWLVADPLNPGQLTTYGSQVATPAPIWSVQPPANPTLTTFNAGTLVTLTAAPHADTPFVGWKGACSSTALTCTLTMNSDLTPTANFG